MNNKSEKKCYDKPLGTPLGNNMPHNVNLKDNAMINQMRINGNI
jgi:hypothetical protein